MCPRSRPAGAWTRASASSRHPAIPQVAQHRSGALPGGDQPHVGGGGRQRAFERVLVVVALRRDDHEGAIVDRGARRGRARSAPVRHLARVAASPPSSMRERPPPQAGRQRDERQAPQGNDRWRRAAVAAGRVPRRPPMRLRSGMRSARRRRRRAGAGPSSSAGPRNSSRGVPSSIAFSASRTTVGSAQAPPIQPRTARSGVIRAVAPSLPDDGRSPPHDGGQDVRLATRREVGTRAG